MKRLFLVLILSMLLGLTIADAGWFRTYGGSEKTEVGTCVQQTTDDGFIVTGVIQGTPWLFKTDSLGNITWWDTIAGGNWVGQTKDGGYILAGVPDLCKTDEFGDTIWTKDFGIYSRCARPTFDGGYVIAGTTKGVEQFILIKTDAKGDSIWMHTYLLPDWSYSWGLVVEQTKDSGYIAAGLIGFTSEGYTRQAFWLLKTNSVGDTLWTYMQGGIEWDVWDDAHCVCQTTDGGYIAVGSIGLLRFSSSGDTIWSRDYLNASWAQQTQDNAIIITGDASASLVSMMPLPNPSAIWLLKTDNNGDSLWRNTYDEGVSIISYVSETSDKGFIMTGGSDYDLCLIKTDSLGLLGITENPIVEADNGWNVPHSIGSYIVLHYKDLPRGFQANVFDVSGRKVDQIGGDGNEGAMTWGINYPPGVYFIQALDNRNQLKTAKVVLVR